MGTADDPLEHEADRVADAVVRGLRGASSSIFANSSASRISRAVSSVAGAAGAELDTTRESRIRRAAGGGPLPASTRDRMERGFGADFSAVRIHTDSSLAPEIGAVAFTSGRDIHFAPGTYRPTSPAGEHLLAHELAHVVQQGAASAPSVRRRPASIQRRSKNPYNEGTSITSHHIIPHELLGKLLAKFEGAAKTELLMEFLPAFETLTLAQLVAQGTLAVTYDGAGFDKVEQIPEVVRHVSFKTMSSDDQGKCGFKVPDVGDLSFAALKAAWAKAQSNEDTTGFADVGDSFFEWQGGNLFYGPERIEPGKKDGFDFDAALVYGQAHADTLAKIYEQMRALQSKDDEASVGKIRVLLQEMNAATRAVRMPAYDASLWHKIGDAKQKRALDVLLPERTATSKVSATIHKTVLRDAILRYCRGPIADVLAQSLAPVPKTEPTSPSTETVAVTPELPKGRVKRTKVPKAKTVPALFAGGDGKISLTDDPSATKTVDEVSRPKIELATQALLSGLFALSLD